VNFQIIPIDFDETENEVLTKAINIFNKYQKAYFLKLMAHRKFSDDKEINWDQIYRDLIDNSSRIIAVTSKAFDDNWFSHTKNKVTVISTADWRTFYSPPGIHCYLLMEFIVTVFYHSSNFGEIESKPHEQTTWCLLDSCVRKTDIIWKMKIGYLCAEHTALFLTHGGSNIGIVKSS